MCDNKDGRKRTPSCGVSRPFFGPITIPDGLYEEIDPVVDEDGREHRRIRVHFGDPAYEGIVCTEYHDELIEAELVTQIPISPLPERRFDLIERSANLTKAQSGEILEDT